MSCSVERFSEKKTHSHVLYDMPNELDVVLEFQDISNQLVHFVRPNNASIQRFLLTQPNVQACSHVYHVLKAFPDRISRQNFQRHSVRCNENDASTMTNLNWSCICLYPFLMTSKISSMWTTKSALSKFVSLSSNGVVSSSVWLWSLSSVTILHDAVSGSAQTLRAAPGLG